MIKETGYKSITGGYEFLFRPVALGIKIENPINLNIPILEHVNYLHKNLKEKIIPLCANRIPTCGDWIHVDGWCELACVSKRFKEVFEGKLKGHWYPTNTPDFFLFLLDNCIDALDETKGTFVNKKKYPYWYESIEGEVFKDEVVNDEYLFTMQIEPVKKLSTDKFERIYRENGFTGIQFYKDINFNRTKGCFDPLRFYKYDDEGNCLNETGGLAI